jgi:hypothetical protein
MMKQPRYSDEVTKLLACLDGQQENTEPDKETPIPDTQEPIKDVYFVFFREREAEEDEQDIIDSILTDVSDLDTAPLTTKPATQPLTKKQARDEQASKHTGFFMMSLLVFLCLTSIALQLHFILNPPIATIILIPQSQTIALNATVQLGRILPPTTLSQEKIVPTTGHGHQDARAAQGTITFYNGQLSQQFVPAGTVLTASSGVQVITDQDAAIPAADLTANPPVIGEVTVSAHAVHQGSAGNIQAYSINEPCCSSVVAKNTQDFSGGADERDFQTVTQADIANAAAPLKTTLAQSMQGALTGQTKSNEALVTPTCTPKISADHQIGQEATQVKVTLTETCGGVAYDTQELENKATQLLTTQAIKKLGSGYSLLGDAQVTTNTATVTGTHPTFAFSCTGVWVYALSDQEQASIKKMIAGKTTQDALHLLESQPGIERVSTSWDENTKLPKDTQNIHLVIFAGL